MSYAQNTYPWYAPNRDASPIQQGAPPRLFNPNAPNGVPTSQQVLPPAQWNTGPAVQQTQPYWHQNQVQQQPQQQPQQHVPVVAQQQSYANAPQRSQWNAPPPTQADPWNWGNDDNQDSESVQSGGGANAWDWSVPQQTHDAYAPQPNKGVGHYPANNDPSAAQYAAYNQPGNYYPTTALNPPQSTITNSNTVQTDTGYTQQPTSGNYYLQQPSVLHAPSLVSLQNSPAVNNNALATGEQVLYNSDSSSNYYPQTMPEQLMAPSLVNYQNSQDNFAVQQPVPDEGLKASYPSTPSVSTPGTDVSGFVAKQTSQSFDGNFQSSTGGNSSMDTLSSIPSSQLIHQGSTDDQTDNSQQSELIEGGLEASLTENDVSEDVQEAMSEISASSMQSHQMQYGNYVAMPNNEFEYLNPTGSTTGTKGLAAQWSTESLHSQGSDDNSSNAGGVSTPIDYNATNYDHQYENYPDSPLDREVSGDENPTPSKVPLSSSSLTTVCQQMEELQIKRIVNEENAQAAENVEVISGSNINGRSSSAVQFPPPPHSGRPISKETSPSPLMQLPPTGPPMSVGSSSGNPYSINRTSSTNKFQGKSGNNDLTKYNLGALPPVQPVELNERAVEPVGLDPSLISGDAVNFETVPDNKEHPDAVDSHQQPLQVTAERNSLSPMASARRPNLSTIGQTLPQDSIYHTSPENQEVTPRWGPDRNQYLETGQLSEDEITGETSQFHSGNRNDWSHMERMIPGQNLTETENATVQSNEVSTPPPGLHRMVPGQVTEHEDNVAQFARPQFNDDRSQDSNDDVLLRRMVPGRTTTEQPVTFATNVMTNYDIPPPGLRRMIPGESSSPESQGVSPAQTGSRVVTGDGQEEIPSLSTAASQAAARKKSDPPSATPNTAGSAQPKAERSETIGSDSVDTFQPPPTDNVPRRDASKKDRHHRNDESGDERDGRRRDNDYRRDESPSGGRYKESRQTKGDRDRHRDDDHRRGDDRRGDDRRGDDRRRDDRGGESRRGDDQKRGSDRRRDARRGEDPRDRRGDDRRGRDSDSESYVSDRYDRDHYRRDKSSDSRRFRDDRGGRHYDEYRDQRNNKSYSRTKRPEQRGSGSEYSDYERRDYDRRAVNYENKPYVRRDYDPRYKARHEESSSWYDPYDQRRYRADRTMGRPESRGNSSRMMYPTDQQAWFTTAKPSSREYWAFYNNLRETNPAAYAVWYRTVYMAQPTAFSEDRGSVHSGRSSENNLYQNRDLAEHENHPPASSTPLRSTPTLFSVAHTRGKLSGHGHLVQVHPNYPLDGQPATVDIHLIQVALEPRGFINQFLEFPGPLIKGVTHKNSVIAFCNQKIRLIEQDGDVIDRKSAILLWQYLILLIRQNGSAVGADIAELLLCDRPATNRNTRSSRSSSTSHGSQHDELPLDTARFNVKPSDEEVTNTYREHLLRGNVKEALDYAMKHGLWGHALFLTSKMDQRLHMNVMTHFLNSLAVNDPLQTLYQLASNRQPLAVTNCTDEKWGDWQPHLAMILSNHTSPEVARKAIITLGDTLAGRGCLHAAHFCYLAGQVELSNYSERSSAKLILVGSSHQLGFQHFATNEAIQMTEILEYATKLRDADHSIVSFQWFKFVYAQRLTEMGLVTEALQYSEELSKPILSHPDHFELSFIKQVFDLGDRLKHNDPIYTTGGGEQTELQWLVRLEQTIHEFNLGICPQSYASQPLSLNQSYSEGDTNYNQQPSSSNVQDNAGYDSLGYHQESLPYQPESVPYQPESKPYQPENVPYQSDQVPYQQDAGQYQHGSGQYQDDQAYGQQNNMHYQQQDNNVQHNGATGYERPNEPSQTDLHNNYQSPWEQNNHEELPKPQISLPNAYVDRAEKPGASKTKSTKSPDQAKKSQPSRPKSASSGWFGGIWDKLSLKPKNQMILPEDKNPTIVWDADRKQWVNSDADGEESTSALGPPPKATDLPGYSAPPTFNTGNPPVMSLPNAVPTPQLPTMTAQQPIYSTQGAGTNSQPAPSTMANGSTTNRFKLNKTGKNFRANYVDVFNSSKMTTTAAPPPPGMFPLIPGGGQSNIFTPDMNAHDGFAANVNDHGPAQAGPMMFDPSNYAQPNAVPRHDNAN